MASDSLRRPSFLPLWGPRHCFLWYFHSAHPCWPLFSKPPILVVLISLLCQRASCLPQWLLNQEVRSWHLHLSKASTSIKAPADALYLVDLLTAHLSCRELTTHQAMTTCFTTIVSLNAFLLFWNTFILAVIIHFESLIASADVLTLLPHLTVDWEHKSFSVSFVLSLFKVMSNRQ